MVNFDLMWTFYGIFCFAISSLPQSESRMFIGLEKESSSPTEKLARKESLKVWCASHSRLSSWPSFSKQQLGCGVNRWTAQNLRTGTSSISRGNTKIFIKILNPAFHLFTLKFEQQQMLSHQTLHVARAFFVIFGMDVQKHLTRK